MFSTTSSPAQIANSRRLRPLIYTNLVTSTPANYQATKRIKGLFGYSEHYKGNPIEDPSLGRILPFQSRSYRKARELNLELWDQENKIDFIEKFLKAQTNLKKIKIRVMEREFKLTNILKQLSEIFGKLSRITRVQIDFKKEHREQALPFVLERLRSLRLLPKLKDVSITLDGVELYPFSVSLLHIGFDFLPNQYLITVQDQKIVEKLMKNTPKFYQLDTIGIDSKGLASLPEEFLDRVAFVISKLNNVQELNLNHSKDLYLPIKPTFNILDSLSKAPKVHVVKLGLAMRGIASISVLKHPGLKAQFLEKVHISMTFSKEITTANLNQILDLLVGMPKLYELSLNFANYPMIDDEVINGIMEKIILMVNLRRLKLVLEYNSTKISEKQTGSLLRSIFKMSGLEELNLEIPTSGLDLSENNEGDIEGLPRLTKMRLVLREYGSPIGENVLGVMELLGRCCRLRELEVNLDGCVIDYEGMTKRLRENVGKLKGLQVLRLHISDQNSIQSVEFVKMLKEWVEIFEGMRSLQEVELPTKYIDWSILGAEGYRDLYEKVSRNKKYRVFDMKKPW